MANPLCSGVTYMLMRTWPFGPLALAESGCLTSSLGTPTPTDGAPDESEEESSGPLAVHFRVADCSFQSMEDTGVCGEPCPFCLFWLLGCSAASDASLLSLRARKSWFLLFKARPDNLLSLIPPLSVEPRSWLVFPPRTVKSTSASAVGTLVPMFGWPLA